MIRMIPLFLLLLLISTGVAAKDTQLTAEWSGVWRAFSGFDRCTVSVIPPTNDDGTPAQVSLDCALGGDAVRYSGPVVERGWHMALAQRGEWGTDQPPKPWGFGLVFAVCHPDIGPSLYFTFTRYAPQLTQSVQMIPERAGKLCTEG